MSRQEIKQYGKQEFRRFPLVTLEPLPDQKDLADYYHRGAKGELGSRIKNLDKPLICGKTAKTYKFWDNLIYHYKHLYPLYGSYCVEKEDNNDNEQESQWSSSSLSQHTTVGCSTSKRT